MRTGAFGASCVALVAVFALLYALYFCRYGYDFTDESYYLIWISDPYYYKWSVSHFGFIYRNLFEILSGDISLLRSINILLIFALSFALSFKVFSLVDKHRSPLWVQFAFSAGVAVSCLTFLYKGLATPSYNSLALQALLVTAIGQLYAQSILSKSSLAGWVLIGVGGWLAFMAKPSTAAALAIWTIFYIVLSKKWSPRALVISGATAMLLSALCGIWIYGSLPGFIKALEIGIELSKLSGAGYSIGHILRLDPLSLNSFEKVFASVQMVFVTASIYIFSREGEKWHVLQAALAMVATLLALAAAFGGIASADTLGSAINATMLVFPLSAIAMSIAPFAPSFNSTVHRDRWSAAISFLFLPLVFSFGTNGNYWNASGSASIFWLLAGILLLKEMIAGQPAPQRLTPMVLAAQIIVTITLFAHVEAPYRQPAALWYNTEQVQVGRLGSILTLSTEYATYIQQAKEDSLKAGFKVGTPMIDLTGQSPGVLYAIGARSAGYPWLAGGYSGSVDVARAALSLMACSDMAQAWVLTEAGGPRAIDDASLDAIGANLQRDYVQVARWDTAPGAGGYPDRRHQQLWKPTRALQDASTACETRQSAIQ